MSGQPATGLQAAPELERPPGESMAGERDKLERYGWRAMSAWVEKKPMTRGQAFVVAIWLVQAKAIAWRSLPEFIWRRGVFKTKEWYDD